MTTADPVDYDLGRYLNKLDSEERFGDLLEQADKLLTDEAKLLLRDPSETALESDHYKGRVACEVFGELIFSQTKKLQAELMGGLLLIMDAAAIPGHPMVAIEAQKLRQRLIDLYVNESRDKLAERLQRNARELREEMGGEQ